MEPDFRKKVLFVVRVLLGTLLLLVPAFLAPDVFLLIFAGILVAIFLSSLAHNLNHYTGIPREWLIGKFFGRAAIGILTTLGLWLSASSEPSRLKAKIGYSLQIKGENLR